MSPPYLFAHWPQVAKRIRAAERLAVFLDFDGTLAPLCPRPEKVRLTQATRAVLRRLARCPRVFVSIISGRRRADLREQVNIQGIRYLGLHGWERSKTTSSTKAMLSLARRARKLLTEHLGNRQGIRIEHKGPITALHYRGAAPGPTRSAHGAVARVLKVFRPQLRLLRGKSIWEILPREVEGKGAAVRALMDRLAGSPLVIYVGDDKSDEAAFATVRDGLTVRVGGGGRTWARFRLKDPEDVRDFLERLEREVTRKTPQ